MLDSALLPEIFMLSLRILTSALKSSCLLSCPAWEYNGDTLRDGHTFVQSILLFRQSHEPVSPALFTILSVWRQRTP